MSTNKKMPWETAENEAIHRQWSKEERLTALAKALQEAVDLRDWKKTYGTS